MRHLSEKSGINRSGEPQGWSLRSDLVVFFSITEIKLITNKRFKTLLHRALVHVAGFSSGLSSKLLFSYLGTVFEFSWNHDLAGNDRGKNEREILQENKGKKKFRYLNGDTFCYLIISKVNCFWMRLILYWNRNVYLDKFGNLKLNWKDSNSSPNK